MVKCSSTASTCGRWGCPCCDPASPSCRRNPRSSLPVFDTTGAWFCGHVRGSVWQCVPVAVCVCCARVNVCACVCVRQWLFGFGVDTHPWLTHVTLFCIAAIRSPSSATRRCGRRWSACSLHRSCVTRRTNWTRRWRRVAPTCLLASASCCASRVHCFASQSTWIHEPRRAV